MSRKQVKEAIEKYVEFLVPHFRLWDWDIRVKMAEPESEETGMCVQIIEGQRSAMLYFAREFRGNSFADIHYFLCHEFAHILEGPLINCVEGMFTQSGLGTTANQLIREAVRQQDELFADHVGKCFAELIPQQVPLLDIIKNTEQGDD